MDALYQELAVLRQKQIQHSRNPSPATSVPGSPVLTSVSHKKENNTNGKANKKGTMSTSYRDYSTVMPPEGYQAPADIMQMNFCEKLHHILSRSDLESIIEWRPHGRAFKIYVPQLFAIHICPEYFGHNSFSRFRHDLMEHGFKHIPSGLDQNGYYHERFLRYRMFLCRHIRPKPKQGTIMKNLHQQQYRQSSSPPTIRASVASLLSAPATASLDSRALARLWLQQNLQQQQASATAAAVNPCSTKTTTTLATAPAAPSPLVGGNKSLLTLASLV